MRTRNFKDDFYFFLNKVKNNENFALTRFSDGEMYMLQGKEIILSETKVKVGNEINTTGPGHPIYDKKTFDPQIHKQFTDILWESFLHKQENYYIGISCKCCVGEADFRWQLDKLGGDRDELTWANILVNSNYPLFMKEFYPEIQRRGAYVFCNESADLNELKWVKGSIRIGNDVFSNLEPIDTLRMFIRTNQLKNELFLFSASALSNIAQYKLFKEFPNNTYIDIGTTLSYEFKIPSKRGYLKEYNKGGSNYKTCIWN